MNQKETVVGRAEKVWFGWAIFEQDIHMIVEDKVCNERAIIGGSTDFWSQS